MLGDITIKEFWELLRRPPHWQMQNVTVRVTEAQFNDAKAMARINENVLGRLGCPECHSGFMLDYLLERDFRVTPELDVVPFEIGVRG